MALTKVLGLIAIMMLSVSAYIFWPLWQEIRGRSVDREMTARTESAIQNGKVDTTYVDLARATGGGVCYGGGNTPAEKNENLRKCTEKFIHQNLVEQKDNLIRDRFLFIKDLLNRWSLLLIALAYATVFVIANRWILKSAWRFSLACAAPAAIFWVLMGGVQLMLEGAFTGRASIVLLPLFGALISGLCGLAVFQAFLSRSATPATKNSFALFCLLIGLIPCGLIFLMAGHC